MPDVSEKPTNAAAGNMYARLFHQRQDKLLSLIFEHAILYESMTASELRKVYYENHTPMSAVTQALLRRESLRDLVVSASPESTELGLNQQAALDADAAESIRAQFDTNTLVFLAIQGTDNKGRETVMHELNRPVFRYMQDEFKPARFRFEITGLDKLGPENIWAFSDTVFHAGSYWRAAVQFREHSDLANSEIGIYAQRIPAKSDTESVLDVMRRRQFLEQRTNVRAQCELVFALPGCTALQPFSKPSEYSEFGRWGSWNQPQLTQAVVKDKISSLSGTLSVRLY
eukprot:jgi/Hompol1/541/HPOL_001627-RA